MGFLLYFKYRKRCLCAHCALWGWVLVPPQSAAAGCLWPCVLWNLGAGAGADYCMLPPDLHGRVRFGAWVRCHCRMPLHLRAWVLVPLQGAGAEPAPSCLPCAL